MNKMYREGTAKIKKKKTCLGQVDEKHMYSHL